MVKVIARIGSGLFITWGMIALFHRLTHEPDQSRLFFWLVLPYPVLIAFTVVIIAVCARNGRQGGAGFSWFAVGIGSAASIGLSLAVSTSLASIMSWAYLGYVSVTYAVPTDPELVPISIAVSAACSVWAGAISATLGSQRPLHHALAAGTVLLLWFCTGALLMQPISMQQLLVALALPVPLAALGAWLQQRQMAPSHG